MNQARHSSAVVALLAQLLCARVSPSASGLWKTCGAALLTLLLLVAGSPAKADMWGYIDAGGIAHFSAEPLDERYELFFRGTESFSAGKGENPPPGARRTTAGAVSGPQFAITSASSAPPKLLAFFDMSPGYKSVKHLLRDASTLHGIDYELLQAVIATESGFNTFAVSPKGAVGLMQLIPPTAERYGVRADRNLPIEKKLTDPSTNIRAGARYLSDLITMFPGQLELAVAAYNAGEGAVQRAGNRIPSYPETRNYVKTVMQLYTHLKPPLAIADARRSSRVRMEMMGGASGRSRMPTGTFHGPGLPVAATPPLASDNLALPN